MPAFIVLFFIKGILNSSTGTIFSLLVTPFAARDLKGVLSRFSQNCLCINRISKMMSSFVV